MGAAGVMQSCLSSMHSDAAMQVCDAWIGPDGLAAPALQQTMGSAAGCCLVLAGLCR